MKHIICFVIIFALMIGLPAAGAYGEGYLKDGGVGIEEAWGVLME